MISGNMVGSYSQMGKTFIFVDEDGNEINGVVVDQETVFTAGDNDVREGKVYASDSGVSVGTKNIPAYYTMEGIAAIPAGSQFKVSIKNYEYTKFLALICAFNTLPDNSVATEKVSINGKVYEVGSVQPISTVTIDSENKSINLGITNNEQILYIIRYFTYKEEY